MGPSKTNYALMRKLQSTLVLLMVLFLASCSTERLVTKSVSYQSIRTTQYKTEIPSDAKIAVGYYLSDAGVLVPVVKNLTDEIMIIDQTKSFFVNSDGQSISYFDPTVRTTTNTTVQSATKGASVNLGAVGSALGVGGAARTLLSGINVGGSNTMGSSTTNTTYFADQPQISLAPQSQGAMSKSYTVSGVGNVDYTDELYSEFNYKNSYCRFSVCISYSIDGGQHFEKLVTQFYANSLLACPVKQHGKVNDALHNILLRKPDAIHEQWWLLRSVNNKKISNDNLFEGGFFLDYQ